MTLLIYSNNKTNCLEGLQGGDRIARVISASFLPWVQGDGGAAVPPPAVASF